MATVQERIKQAKEKIEHVRMGGGEKAIEKQHSKGKLTAHERLDLLFDEGTFVDEDGRSGRRSERLRRSSYPGSC